MADEEVGATGTTTGAAAEPEKKGDRREIKGGIPYRQVFLKRRLRALYRLSGLTSLAQLTWKPSLS
jgi:hypothetical protein